MLLSAETRPERSRRSVGCIMVLAAYTGAYVTELSAVLHTEDRQESLISDHLENWLGSYGVEENITVRCKNQTTIPGPLALRKGDAWALRLPFLSPSGTFTAPKEACDNMESFIVDYLERKDLDQPPDIREAKDYLFFGHEAVHSGLGVVNEACASKAGYEILRDAVDYDNASMQLRIDIDTYISLYDDHTTGVAGHYHADHCETPLAELFGG